MSYRVSVYIDVDADNEEAAAAAAWSVIEYATEEDEITSACVVRVEPDRRPRQRYTDLDGTTTAVQLPERLAEVYAPDGWIRHDPWPQENRGEEARALRAQQAQHRAERRPTGGTFAGPMHPVDPDERNER